MHLSCFTCFNLNVKNLLEITVLSCSDGVVVFVMFWRCGSFCHVLTVW